MKLGEVLQHHGVKGMRWGVRRYQPYTDGKKGKFLGKVKKKLSDSLPGQYLRSAKRTVETVNIKRNMDNMSTSEIKKQASRIGKEADMKRLSTTRKEKKDYRNRSRMSDQEINRKVDRLRAKDLLSQNADKVSSSYVKKSKRIIDTAQSLTLTSIMSDGKMTGKDAVKAILDPNYGGTKLKNKVAEDLGNMWDKKFGR